MFNTSSKYTTSDNLQVTADPGKQIAGLLKIYSKKIPARSRNSGIAENASLPTSFVFKHFLRVAFDQGYKEIRNDRRFWKC